MAKTFIQSVAFFILFFGALSLFTGCAALNPNGKVTAGYDPATGMIHYESDKSLNVEMVKDGDKITLKIQSDAAAGIDARNDAAEANASAIGKLIELIPKR